MDWYKSEGWKKVLLTRVVRCIGNHFALHMSTFKWNHMYKGWFYRDAICVCTHSVRGTGLYSGGCMLSFIHGSLWQTWNSSQTLCRQIAVSASSKLRAHGVMYTHFLLFQREGDTSQSLSDRGSWDNRGLWFPAMTPANQKERHPDCRNLGMCCAEEASSRLQFLIIGYTGI